MMKTVAIDFDGPIHRYSNGWSDGSIYDDPSYKALESIKELQKRGIAVFVFTSRDVAEVAEWLAERDIATVVDDGFAKFWNDPNCVLVTNRKLPAVAYIDDRAIRWTTWHNAMLELTRYEDIATPASEAEQPLPTVNGRADVQSRVILDIRNRRELGRKRYGTALQPFNGRDALRDLYEELLDATMYTRQTMMERDAASYTLARESFQLITGKSEDEWNELTGEGQGKWQAMVSLVRSVPDQSAEGRSIASS